MRALSVPPSTPLEHVQYRLCLFGRYQQPSCLSAVLIYRPQPVVDDFLLFDNTGDGVGMSLVSDDFYDFHKKLDQTWLAEGAKPSAL